MEYNNRLERTNMQLSGSIINLDITLQQMHGLPKGTDKWMDSKSAVSVLSKQLQSLQQQINYALETTNHFDKSLKSKIDNKEELSDDEQNIKNTIDKANQYVKELKYSKQLLSSPEQSWTAINSNNEYAIENEREKLMLNIARRCKCGEEIREFIKDIEENPIDKKNEQKMAEQVKNFAERYRQCSENTQESIWKDAVEVVTTYKKLTENKNKLAVMWDKMAHKKNPIEKLCDFFTDNNKSTKDKFFNNYFLNNPQKVTLQFHERKNKM